MNYISASHIKSVKDVEAFFHHIVFERKVNFHPDDMFENYVSYEGGVSTFSLDECVIHNRLMDESFAVCKKEGVDIYEIGLEELQTTVNWPQYDADSRKVVVIDRNPYIKDNFRKERSETLEKMMKLSPTFHFSKFLTGLLEP